MLSLTEKFARCEYVYPGRVYDGVEIFIDPEAFAESPNTLSDEFGIDLAELRRKYCHDGQTYITKKSPCDSVIARLTGEGDSIGERVGRVTGTVDLLAFLLEAEEDECSEQFLYYTKSQVEIARKTERIIMRDLAAQHTVNEFSRMFSVS